MAKGLLLLGSTTGAVAFDATGATNCSGTPKVCQPLRRYGTPSGAVFITVAGPTVYVGNLDPHFDGPWVGKVYGYDVAGASGCSGNPVVCLPRFAASAGLTANPVVANGKLFVLTGDPLAGESLDGVDVAGGTGCAGMIPFCARVRSSALPQGFAQIGATKTILFALTGGNGAQANGGRLLGFGVGSEGCHGSPVVCDALVSIPVPPNAAGFAPFAGHVAVAVNSSPTHGRPCSVYSLPS